MPRFNRYSVSAPNERTLALATAYQATEPSRPAIITINLTSTASITLTSGTTNTATVWIDSTNGVASGSGTAVGQYMNGLTGTLVVGANISKAATTTITFALPAGWYFAIVQTAGTISITSAYDQVSG